MTIGNAEGLCYNIHGIYNIVVFMLHGNTIHVLLRCMERRGKEGHTDLMA